ncbi:MAG: AraC-like DNA-binding protein [Shewanella sp.]|jgi:AraC-like DNA-binding protein
MQEKIQYWQPSIVKEMELSKAHFNHFAFDQHVHLDYHLGVVDFGCQEYRHKGSSYRLSPQQISTLNPDESHNGFSFSQNGYQAHVMSLPTEYVKALESEFNQPLFFNQPLCQDPFLYQCFLTIHNQLTYGQNQVSPLQAETMLMAFMTELFLRNNENPLQQQNHYRLSKQQLNTIKALFHADIGSSFDLASLANIVGLSKFQFLRQFKSATGMTPHAYLKRMRLEYAKKALVSGFSVGETAQQVGFFDQSHFNKAFKHAFLTTPTQFKHQVEQR